MGLNQHYDNYNNHSIMTKQDKDKLTMILLAQSVAGSRNVKPMKRLEALHNDIGSVILGASKTDCAQASWALTKTKELA
jgi:hypothetical protein